MSLLGRLEDLSLPDIVQIVFLSRRTGILEIIDHNGRHTVLFQNGLIVNAGSPESSDLASFLERGGHLTSDRVASLRHTEEAGIPIGTAILEMNLLDRDTLAKLIQERITAVVLPLLGSRDGEFNFILSDSIGPLDIEYDPKAVFREGGIPPQKIIGGDGDKLKPLRGLEESMKVGKALLRGGPAVPAPLPTTPQLDLQPAKAAEPSPQEAAAVEEDAPFAALELAEDNVLPFPAPQDNESENEGGLADLLGDAALDEKPSAPALAPIPEPAPAPAPPTGETSTVAATAKPHFKITSDSDLKLGDKNVLLYERSPLLRVAAKRAFSKRGLKIAQYGSIEDTRRAASDLLRQNEFFITFLELSGATDNSAGGDAGPLLSAIKKKNHMLPVVVIDRDADLKVRSRLLELGADHYLTKPSEAHLQPALADEQLALFAEELVMFAERSFEEYELMVSDFEGGSKTLYDLAQQEKASRSAEVLKYLINELSNPNDISELVATILRLASEYVDRAVFFVGRERHFFGVDGVGVTGGGAPMNERARTIRISYAEASVLSDVAATGEAHRGKIRRTPANAQLITALGSVMPSEVVVLPIKNRGQVIGLLYADNAEAHEPLGDMSGLEVFLSQAGFALENAIVAAARRGDRTWDAS